MISLIFVFSLLFYSFTPLMDTWAHIRNYIVKITTSDVSAAQDAGEVVTQLNVIGNLNLDLELLEPACLAASINPPAFKVLHEQAQILIDLQNFLLKGAVTKIKSLGLKYTSYFSWKDPRRLRPSACQTDGPLDFAKFPLEQRNAISGIQLQWHSTSNYFSWNFHHPGVTWL